MTSYSPFQTILQNPPSTDKCVIIGTTGVTIVTDPWASKFTVSEDYKFVKDSLLKKLHEGKWICFVSFKSPGKFNIALKVLTPKLCQSKSGRLVYLYNDK